MQCPICRGEKNWENVDQYRTKPMGMSLCKTCGFISYPEKYKSKAEIIEYYRKAYRNPPNAIGIYTGERKIQYHGHMLCEMFSEWRKAERKDILVCDVGSAFGMFLNWVRVQLPGAEVIGVELTTSFIRNAWHLYQVKTIDDFDDSRKYDLISSYKSLEHMLDPDIELRRYITSLKDDGFLYLSVPLWFEALRNFGSSGFDIEYYYSTNHINTWTRKHVDGLIASCGGEVVKVNTTFYDTTWLIKRNDALISADRSHCFEDAEKIKEKLEAVYAAGEAFEIGDYGKVLEVWPNCPPAWIGHYERSRKQLHEQGFEKIYSDFCSQAIAACPEESDMHYLAADVCARYDQYEKAIEHLGIANNLRPNQAQIFMLLGNCFRALAGRVEDESAKVKLYEQARQSMHALAETSTQHRGEALTWMMHDNANRPTPFEATS